MFSMKTKKSFSEFLKEVEPLKVESTGEMSGGFVAMGGDNPQQPIQVVIMNGILVGVLGSACACSCQCAC